MLGPHFKEKRMREGEEQQKRIAQIHKAVAHFQSAANACRQNLHGGSVNDKSSWEVEYTDILHKE
jgi:hypothetical protein